MVNQDRTIQGILCLCAGIGIFTLQDTILKFASGSYALTQAMTLRGIVALPILLVMVSSTTGLAALTRDLRFVYGRAVVLFIAYFAYYLAFPALPLADAAALYFTVPLFVVVLAGPYLGERSNWKVWASISAGMIGVVIMLRPGEGLFEPAALLSLLSAMAYAFGQLMARKHNATTSPWVFAFHQTLLFLIIGVGLAGLFDWIGLKQAAHPSLNFLVRPWVMPTLLDGFLMCMCGVIAAFGSVLLIKGYQMAPANTAAAFEFTALPYLAVLGYIVFEEIPSASTFIGSAFIVAAGLMALRARATSS
ncbi:MAG: DMT family transporter [Rhizobiaceae bacterium]